MPSMRPRRRRPAPNPALGLPSGGPGGKLPKGIVAAVSRLRRNPNGQPTKIYSAGWQTEGWRQYDINGALKYAANWLARSMSRYQLIVVELDERGNVVKETDDPEVLAVVSGLLSNPAAVSEMLYQIGIQLFVPGDMHIIIEVGPDGDFTEFTVASTEEIQVGLGYVVYDDGSGKPRTVKLEDALVFRLHDPHPRRKFEANSPTRSALPTLREFEELGKYIHATIQSRVAGAGILGVPSEMVLPAAPEDQHPGETPFLALLAEALIEAIDDLDSAAALVPVVLQAPAEALAAMQWLTHPNSELQSAVAELREAAMRRLGVDLDVPAEVLLGSADANRYNVWQIEEQSIKIHIDPKMITVVRAFTDGFLKPNVEALGKDPRKYAFWFDNAALVLRPDRSTDAKDLYDRGELSGEALLRETGFEASDAPTGDEKKIRAILKVMAAAPGAADQLIPDLAKLLGIEITPPPVANPQGSPTQNGEVPAPNQAPRNNPEKPSRQDPNGPTQNPTVKGT